MYCIVSECLSSQAVVKLKKFGEVIQLYSHNITYSAIASHPDIFTCKTNDSLILAKNAPTSFVQSLQRASIAFEFGLTSVQQLYPFTCHFNAVITDNHLIHNLNHTDTKILEACSNLDKIHVEQGYTRCNLLPLKGNHFITSDKGIEKALKQKNLQVLYVNPTDIKLDGVNHGFFGGCCGIHDDCVFIHGSLNKFNDGAHVKTFLQNLNYTIIELNDAPLEDCGSIIIVASN